MSTLAEFEALLGVQEHDLALDRLRHRRETLPARAELVAKGTELRVRSGELVELRASRDVVLAEEKRLDDEARTIGAKADDMNKKLYSGTVASPKELQAMQADIDMLLRHRSDIEDTELEVIDRRETLDASVADLEKLSSTLADEVARLQQLIGAAEVEIDAEIAQESAARAREAGSIPASLLGDYERRRAQNRGTGAARLVGTTCQACHLTIPSTEAEAIRRAAGSEIAYCDNCGAILVP